MTLSSLGVGVVAMHLTQPINANNISNERVSPESLKAKFSNADGTSYVVPIIFLMGSPIQWDSENITTEGYLEVGAGTALLTIAPGLDHKTPRGCTVDISFAKNSTTSQEGCFGSKRTLVKVSGKFIIFGNGSTTGSLGAIVDADVTLLKRIDATSK